MSLNSIPRLAVAYLGFELNRPRSRLLVPISAALLAGLEGALAGTALGSLAGALIGWGVPKDRCSNTETGQGGRVFIVVPSNPEIVARPTACSRRKALTTSKSTSRRILNPALPLKGGF